MSTQLASFPIRLFLYSVLLVITGFLVINDLASRKETHLISKIDADSSGVSSLLANRLEQTQNPTQLITLGYRLASADQCDLAIQVFNRAQTLEDGYRDAALVAGWCHLKLAQGSSNQTDQLSNLSMAQQLISQGQAIDPLNSFGQTLSSAVKQLESGRP
jgi:hypothetical protein